MAFFGISFFLFFRELIAKQNGGDAQSRDMMANWPQMVVLKFTLIDKNIISLVYVCDLFI